ncbi:MAG: lysozyme inhibitor LprI family protein [Hyphomonadaceae bacterium]
MRQLYIACALALIACASLQAHADSDVVQASAERLTACVASAGADRAALEQCKGVAAQACIEAEGGVTMAHVLCWDSEASGWREMMAVAATRLAVSASYRDAARLDAANAAWASWAEAECEYWAWEVGGGVGEQVDRVRCAAHISADRAITLIIADSNEGRAP